MSGLRRRFDYWRRIFSLYVLRRAGALDFWHERPAKNAFIRDELGPYYMTFRDKAAYAGPKDERGVVMLDYRGDIGVQYNPIAVAQYGLAHMNLFFENGKADHLAEATKQADWLVSNLKKNEQGIPVWQHLFPWRYVETMEPGWYSGLAQGMGISLLARMYAHSSDKKYYDAAVAAFTAFTKDIADGGVRCTDSRGNVWLEEYIVSPPSHILNGFFWTLWGIWDYWLLTGSAEAKELFDACVKTLEWSLPSYDLGYWSRYDLSEQKLPMIASPFYHRLHIVQLDVTRELTDNPIFGAYARKFAAYQKNPAKRTLALAVKSLFKIFYF